MQFGNLLLFSFGGKNDEYRLREFGIALEKSKLIFGCLFFRMQWNLKHTERISVR